MSRKIFLSILLLLFMFSCGREQVHIESAEPVLPGDLGVSGVLPVIGQVYIDNVEVQTDTDGRVDEMIKFHQIYTLASDIIVDDYSILEGGKCIWKSKSKSNNAWFEGNKQSIEVPLKYNEFTTSYECNNVKVEVKQDGAVTENYDPDSIITVKYIDKFGKYITPVTIGSTEPYISQITLNPADRHNIKDITTSPTTSLFWRKDGIFQAGFTAYRGMLGLHSKIGSALYEARVKAPGGTNEVSPSKKISDYENEVLKDKERMEQWVKDDSVNEEIGIFSKSAFVSSYGPPIAMPAFRKENTNYNRLRTVMLSHNNYPVILSDDKKFYIMGAVTNFDKDGSGIELEGIYRRHIRKNDIWFSYSGVDIKNEPNISEFHTGAVYPANSTPSKFVILLNVANDLDTTIALNEIDKEYYITGNPNYNAGFCSNKVEPVSFISTGEDDENTILSFDYNMACGEYDSNAKVGAIKIPCLQKLIGDGKTAVSTDSRIYYIGRDGKGYLDLRPSSENYKRIMKGQNIKSTPIEVHHSEMGHIHTQEDWENRLYVVEFGVANIKHVVTPTLLLKDVVLFL